MFTSIPIVNFWTFYRIRKLRRCLVYAFVPSVAVSFISNTVFLVLLVFSYKKPLAVKSSYDHLIAGNAK